MAEFERKWAPRSDEELLRHIEEVRARELAEPSNEIRAVAARYDEPSGRMVLELSNGCAFAFPAELGQGLRGASAADLAAVEITPSGTGLHWAALDADLRVEALLRGVFGTRRWMAEVLGRAGGASTSEKKAAAARANGRKGGRPRKAAGS